MLEAKTTPAITRRPGSSWGGKARCEAGSLTRHRTAAVCCNEWTRDGCRHHSEWRAKAASPLDRPIVRMRIGSRAITPVEGLVVKLRRASAQFAHRQLGFIFTIYYNPLVMWVWIGGAVLGIGTLIALLPNRQTASKKRQPSKAKQTEEIGQAV